MKKLAVILAALSMLVLTACSGKASADEWTRTGFFQDEDGNMLSITFSDIEDNEGWFVGLTLGDESYGNVIRVKGKTLQGNIVPDNEEGEFIVTISEEGEDGLLLEADSGETCHFIPMDMSDYEAEISLSIIVEGPGYFAFAEGTGLEPDADYTWTSTQQSIYEPAVYTIGAKADKGSRFVKWIKDGGDYSTDEQITVEVTESAEYTAVFAAE